MIIKGKISSCEQFEKNGRVFYRVAITPENPVDLPGFVFDDVPVGSRCLCSFNKGRVDDITII